MEIITRPEFLTLYDHSSISLTKKYRLQIQQLRIKFSNIIITRARIYKGTSIDNEKIILDIDIQRDPKSFWFSWVKINRDKNRKQLREKDDIVTKTLNDSLVRESDNQSTEILEDRVLEYLIYQSPSEGSIIMSVPEGQIIPIPSKYEWKIAIVSPDGDKLAVICDKKSRKPIRVFDFRNPETTPYYEYALSDSPNIKGIDEYSSKIKFRDNNTLIVESRVNSKDEYSMNFDYHTETYELKIRKPS